MGRRALGVQPRKRTETLSREKVGGAQMSCLRNEAKLAGQEINACGEARQGLGAARL